MQYDVLIVGGRVAGASLALLLAQGGHRVLMIDRDQFPSDTLSTHYLSPFSVEPLRRLGVLEDVEAAGFRRIARARTWIEDCLVEGPVGPPGTYALAPRRSSLDATLIRHAQERGEVTFWERTNAEGLVTDADGTVHGAVVRTEQGERHEVRARVVVGADGKYSKVAAWVNAETYLVAPAMRPIYYGYFHGVKPLQDAAVELFFVRNHIGFLFPMRPDEDCLVLEVQPDDFETFRADPHTAFWERYRALPGMAERLAHAELEGKLHGTRGSANHFRKPFGPGWVLAGDAGYLKDPVTGYGIGDALSQNFRLAKALDAALRGAEWDATLGEFQRRRDETALPLYQETLAATRLRDAPPESLTWLRAALINAHFARALLYWLPTVLMTGLPDELQPTMQRLATLMGAASQ
jgi:2-polyprenyl-6-methoxyphenol hydroxylase-like FAD-dependent oxidoreductase